MSLLSRAAVVVASLLLAVPVFAADPSAAFPQDTTLAIAGPGISLVAVSGSEIDALDFTSTTFTATLLAGQAAVIRYPGPNPGRFPNDQSLPICHLVGGNNDLVLNGPITVTVTPVATPCSTGGGGGGGGSAPISVSLSQPNGGQTYIAGQTYDIFWASGGTEPHVIRIDLSLDGGLTYTVPVASNEFDDGIFSWVVPETSTPNAKLRIQSLAAGNVVRAIDASDAFFTIISLGQSGQGPSAYTAQAATASSPNIDADKRLTGSVPPAVVHCVESTLIKLPSDNNPATQYDSAVYYCSRDGKRHAFSTHKLYQSWYPDFSGVIIVSASTMASIPLGSAVTYRPGVRMLKLQTDPKTYAVDHGGVLRWVTSESVAVRLYGSAWNAKVDDISDAFFADYTVGAPIY